jgi:3-methyl-2-oxobutanoate hydroxymethyltransferase
LRPIFNLKRLDMAGYISDDTRKVTTHRLIEMKQRGEKISMLTSYDYTMAQIVDGAGIDVILVGDSASNVMAGNVTTLPITLDQMIYHGKSVVRGVKRAMVVVDMPFGSYQGNEMEGLASAIRIMKESHADALKLEGGEEIIDTVKRILSAGIPVMGHLGLMPQSINKYGTYTVRAKDDAEAEKLIRDAHLLEEAGCFGLVLEDSCSIGITCRKRTDHSGDRYRCRWRCRRTGIGNSGYVGYE